MAVAIKSGTIKGGGLGGLGGLLKIGIGAMTGGLGGAALGALSSSDTPIGRAVSMYQMGSGALDKAKGMLGSTPSITDNFKAPELGDSIKTAGPSLMGGANLADESPIARRMSMMGQDPTNVLHSGLEALRDPSIPQELRDSYAPTLLKAKHFGRYGGSL